ncbi:GNAT family N-acetyltransferase [Chryseosolibacter indicus]|uniref:GNAT family N-acetyltransferase n=1 Tax=Chryseosolibacter indicus TaxID=2782351 RepID=A0ABS5VWN6_9BACT|nr:GNAT family N-acetyltransferase [Chryseosolibacter indicus]MBT1705838.1 GNAT family N-acetyltransferase [Chryseosolibacter indicus]
MAEIRKATPTDLESLSQLFDAYRVFYGKKTDIEGAQVFLTERIKNNDSELFVSITENTVSGFVQLYPLFSSVRMKKLWLLNDLFVDERFRGRGISLMLINAAKELCMKTGACGMFLETAKANNVGNQLYPRAGFTLNADHNFYDWSV